MKQNAKYLKPRPQIKQNTKYFYENRNRDQKKEKKRKNELAVLAPFSR